MIRSLRFRLAVGGLIAIGLALLLVWWTLSSVFTDYVLGQYRQEMSILSDSLAAAVVVRTVEGLVHGWVTEPTSAPAEPAALEREIVRLVLSYLRA